MASFRLPQASLLIALASAAQAETPAAATDVLPETKPVAEEPTKPSGFFDNIAWDRTFAISLLAAEGTDAERTAFRPLRQLRLSSRSKLILKNYSLHWRVRYEASRDAIPGATDHDDDYSGRDAGLPNGSVLRRNHQFIVQEAYAQYLQEGWLAQAGAQQFAWGPADSVNTLSVMSPQDLRAGFIGDKETKLAALPSVRLALLGDTSTFNIIYAPWQQPPLTPSPSQNWYVRPDNLAFEPTIVPDDQVRSQGSYAFKYDRSIPNGDITLLYYQGADYDLLTVPTALRVVNNQPLQLESVQILRQKTAYGAGYSQTLGAWVLKAEGLYSPNKRTVPDVDRAHIEDETFPLPLKKTAHYQATVGFNYFAPISNLYGIPLGDTVLTAEYYRSRYLADDLMPPLMSDLVIGNLRTALLEDRLEVMTTYVADTTNKGHAWSTRFTFHGATLQHALNIARFDGAMPAANDIGSVFYYWRRNDFVSYEATYQF